MNISATLKNSFNKNEVKLRTETSEKTITISSKPEGFGSAVNGGELLFLSLATCFCNDLYREASKRAMKIESVEVTVSGSFGKEGAPASAIFYKAMVEAPKHSKEEISNLINFVDTIAEVHNTLRNGIKIDLKTS